MAKDPAFLFYSADFTVGTQFFTAEQVGIYIRLLCAQHQHGRLYEHHMKIICGSYDFHSDILRVVKEKFIVDEQGRFFNERLEVETQKRAAYSKSRGENRSKGLLKKQLENNHMNIISSSYEYHMENENENINTDDIVIKKTKKDKPKKESKIMVAPDVNLTQSEHDKLMIVHGGEFMNIAYTWFANYKIEKGYKTKSDYLTIIRWVIDAVKKQQNGNQAITTGSGRAASRNAGSDQLQAMFEASFAGQTNTAGSTGNQSEIFTPPV